MATTQQVKTIRHDQVFKVLTFQETAVPYTQFKEAGFEIDFVTEKGNMPECDAKMLTGMTQKLLVGFSVLCVPDPCQQNSLFVNRARNKMLLTNTIQ